MLRFSLVCFRRRSRRRRNVMGVGDRHTRRRGMFFHVETSELDDTESESAEGMPVRIARRRPVQTVRPVSRSRSSGRPGHRNQTQARDTAAFQICDRDWQPSTVTDEPLIQLARGDARNATTSPTSSARPKRPNGSSLRTNSAIASGSALTRLSHEPPGKRIDPAPRCSRECRPWRAAAPSPWPG